MIHVMADVQIEDLARFISVFSTKGAELRGSHGSLGATVYQHADDPQRLCLLIALKDREALDAFRADPLVKEAMQLSGTKAPPVFTFLNEIATMPR